MRGHDKVNQVAALALVCKVLPEPCLAAEVDPEGIPFIPCYRPAAPFLRLSTAIREQPFTNVLHSLRQHFRNLLDVVIHITLRIGYRIHWRILISHPPIRSGSAMLPCAGRIDRHPSANRMDFRAVIISTILPTGMFLLIAFSHAAHAAPFLSRRGYASHAASKSWL